MEQKSFTVFLSVNAFKIAIAPLLFTSFLLLSAYTNGQKNIVLENSLFSRSIDIEKGKIATTSFKLKTDGTDLIKPGSNEFSFKLWGQLVTGSSGDFEWSSTKKKETQEGGQQTTVKLVGVTGRTAGLELELFYENYPELALVRKWLVLRNNSNQFVKISNLFWEDLNMDGGDWSNCWIYGNYARNKQKPPFVGGRFDPAVIVEGTNVRFVLGNESPGIMKYTSVYESKQRVAIGFPPSGNDFSFERTLKPGEVFTSPKSFIIFSEKQQIDQICEEELALFIRKYLGVKLYERSKIPAFHTNTWNPFRVDINEKLVMELVDAVAGTGCEYFIIDDGWQTNFGDWEVDTKKFPNGLKPVCDHIREKDMKPGLWFTICSAKEDSKAYKKYFQYAVKDKDGNPTNIHGWSSGLSFLTMDITSPWYDHIKSRMSSVIHEYGIEYVKLDLAMIKSAYIMEPERMGSYASTEAYNGRNEFFYRAYEKLLQLYGELSAEFPELIIDCTYEIWGDHHIMDYSLMQHAQVAWVSNFEADPPEGSRDIRWLAWNRGRVVPTITMLVGNQKFEKPNHEFSYFSNLGSMPLMLGDPRKLTQKEKDWYKKYVSWFRGMIDKYEVHKYYQTSPFDEPRQKNWDGFARFNTEMQAGLVCVFRNESPDSERNFRLSWLVEGQSYQVKNVITGEVSSVTGDVLMQTGLKVSIPTENTAALFEVIKEN